MVTIGSVHRQLFWMVGACHNSDLVSSLKQCYGEALDVPFEASRRRREEVAD